ncbi:hypothetical protein PTTG_12189 [Puccinia triticina 1-1 BBBD Race 1]|uniref:Uncharacterized protein n=1 Tax=Puccinia triticina (isolate 1-1 / race 1 (BBBD)) TaxID=630390 RepID=A0A180H3H6_PUCT1|nr:hypothetical protein PTTG_12189 [Puccinia triticina 1-1 BBBD Race 1]WAR57603.1 hypothetical protein PtB15_8B655 [Puccinia triticina]
MIIAIYGLALVNCLVALEGAVANSFIPQSEVTQQPRHLGSSAHAPQPSAQDFDIERPTGNFDFGAGSPTPPGSGLLLTTDYTNSSTLLHHNFRAPADGLSRRQDTTAKLFTQNMNNPPPIVSAVNNTNNRAPPPNRNATRPPTINNNGIGTINNNNIVKSFTDTVQISGDLIRTQSAWNDGLRIDTFSATPHVLSIKKKMNPASAKFVTAADPSRGFLGGEWRELTNFSYMVSFEGEFPDDLSFRISAPYDKLQPPMNVAVDDEVYLGLYDPNRSGWVVDTERMENRRRDKRVDLIGIPAPSGEYRLLARSSRDPASSMALSFGNGTDGLFKVLAPGGLSAAPPLQVGTWQDGSRIIIRSLQAMQIRMETSSIATGFIPLGYEAATRYGLLITTTSPAGQVIMNLQLAYVPTQLEAKGFFPNDLVMAGRPLRANQQYQILSATTISGNGALMNIPMNIVEGEYLLLVRSN